MQRLLRIAALGAVLLPVGAYAQTAPGAAGGPPQLTDSQRAQMRSTMEQGRAQMERLHQQSRLQMLGALTPAHRSALATITGNLAVAPNPDYAGAARQIDALLSPGERQAVINAHTAMRTQSRTLRDQQRQAFLSNLTPDERAQMEAHRPAGAGPGFQRGPGADGARNETPDAGMILLRSSGAHDAGEMHGPGGYRQGDAGGFRR